MLYKLFLTDIKEGIAHTIVWAQGGQKDLVQRKALWMQDLAEVQALQGKELLLADIMKEEMAHQIHVSVLSQLPFWHADEIKVHSEEIKPLSTLLERQQAILEKVQEQQVVSLKTLSSASSNMAWGTTKGAIWNSA